MADISQIVLKDAEGNVIGTYDVKDATVPHDSKTAQSGGTALSLVTTGEKYNWNQHVHGDILNDGSMLASTQIGNGDRLIISDADGTPSNILTRTTLSFDGSTATQCLTRKGTWQTFSNLAIGTTSTTASAGDHTHGSITNGGAITGTTALASGDGIIFADSSDSSKLKRSSITFDGSTTTQCLTKKGTWANFTNNAGTVTGSGTANYLAKWSSGSGLTNGALYSYVTTGFTTARCTVVAGGYQQIGKVVHVDIHIKFTAATTATQVILGIFPEEAVTNVSLVGTVDGSYQDTIYGFRINAKNLYANGSRSNGGQWHVFGSYIAK